MERGREEERKKGRDIRGGRMKLGGGGARQGERDIGIREKKREGRGREGGWEEDMDKRKKLPSRF